jgi:hypothetical protein
MSFESWAQESVEDKMVIYNGIKSRPVNLILEWVSCRGQNK